MQTKCTVAPVLLIELMNDVLPNITKILVIVDDFALGLRVVQNLEECDL
jgi:hypothetical protein